MEVHHHAHTPDPGLHRGKKKWTHYFWEFLMLFLAVTLGFFVENQREHYIEHQREKQFIRSLYNDVRADTANIGRIINARTNKERLLDSFSYMMNSDDPMKFIKDIYVYAIYAGRTLPYRFVPNDGTIQQLKNSGAFRLIRKRVVVDSISKYDISVRSLLGQYAVEENQIEHYRTAASKIFHAVFFNQMMDENAAVLRVPEQGLQLQPYANRELYEWNYRVYGLNGINKANRRDLRLLLRQAGNLLTVLQKEYNLK
ncbi:MAG TPA: hypothetical protein VFP97_03665 [Chitinophagaceae bacterium]|nr:hypothetical protein [Chitinophagaceae bacterium]